MALGGGVKNLTAKKSPDMLGEKIGTKRFPVRAPNIPTISKCTVFQGEAVRDDGRSPKPLFGNETASFWVAVFGQFICGFLGVPLTHMKPSSK